MTNDNGRPRQVAPGPVTNESMAVRATPTRQISAAHARLLSDSAVDLEVARAAGVFSVDSVEALPDGFLGKVTVPALAFPYRGIDEKEVVQLRPDAPTSVDGRPVKYLSPAGVAMPVTVHPTMRARVLDPGIALVIVEGTKQHLAAVSVALEPDHAIVGIAGCRGWSQEGALSPSMKAIPMHGREVIVLFDADRSTNPAVYDAGEDLRKQLTMLGGARQVRYASLPGHGSQGLDDVLAQVSRDERAAVLARVLEGASQDSGSRPSGGSRFFGKGGLQAKSLAEDILSGRPMALSPGDDLLFYRDGVYGADANSLAFEVASRLDEAFRSVHVATVRDFIIADLASRGRRVRVGSRLLNVANGMLDPLSGELLKHDPSYLSATQFPVGWDPHATAPVYEEWVRQCCGDQVEDLEETLSAMLDPGRSPTKAVLLYGPSRSGKSTLLRLARAVVGERNASAVSLHQISTNKFMAAELDGKRLNAAADLSAGHIEDLSSFKLATGGDPIQAERKFGQPFVFTNRALFLFAANEIPSVGENSGAYLERMRPFLFGVSFAGREDPEIEERMLSELPGILASWVRALQRRTARGSWLPTSPEVAAEFARGSDKVRLFLQECTRPDERGTGRRQVYTSYQQWCQSNGYASLGRNKFQARIRSAGVGERQDRALCWCFQVRIVDPDGPGAGTAGGQSPAVESGDSCDNFPTTSTLAEGGELQCEMAGGEEQRICHNCHLRPRDGRCERALHLPAL